MPLQKKERKRTSGTEDILLPSSPCSFKQKAQKPSGNPLPSHWVEKSHGQLFTGIIDKSHSASSHSSQRSFSPKDCREAEFGTAQASPPSARFLQSCSPSTCLCQPHTAPGWQGKISLHLATQSGACYPMPPSA